MAFTRANSDVPGPLGRLHYYLPHSSGLCHLAVWRPSASFQDAKVAIFVHGEELGCKPGWDSMTTGGALAAGYLDTLATTLQADGYVIVSIDYPVCSTFRSTGTTSGTDFRTYASWQEVHPTAMWPEQPRYVAGAVQYIKSNWCGIPGIDETLFGQELWGAGNSIDPAKVVLVGDKWGAQLAMYASLHPTGWFPYERSVVHETSDRYVPRDSHRPAALILRDVGPIDFTQFYVNPSITEITGVPTYLRGDRFGPFMRCESQRRWGSGDYSSMPEPGWGPNPQASPMYHIISPQWKRQSPWFLLQEEHAENANLPMHIEITGEGYDSYDTNLASTHWNPGTMLNNTAQSRCWMQPEDGRIQGSPLRSALQTYGGSAGTGTPIRRSVVRDPVSTTYPLSATGAAYASEVSSWLEGFGL